MLLEAEHVGFTVSAIDRALARYTRPLGRPPVYVYEKPDPLPGQPGTHAIADGHRRDLDGITIELIQRPPAAG